MIYLPDGTARTTGFVVWIGKDAYWHRTFEAAEKRAMAAQDRGWRHPDVLIMDAETGDEVDRTEIDYHENPTLASAQRVIAAGPREWPPEQLALFARIYDFGHVNYHQQDQKHVDALFDLGLVMYQPPNEYHSEGIVEITEAGNEFADNIESVYLGYPGR